MSSQAETELAKARRHEELLVFPAFNENTAWLIGNELRVAAEQLGQAVSIDIRRGDDCLFFSAMPGTGPNNADWARRKRNFVNLVHTSSYALNKMRELGDDLITLMGLDLRDYTPHGGCFPIRVAGTGVIGTIAVSGLPQRDDHKLIVDVLAAHLEVDLGDSAF